MLQRINNLQDVQPVFGNRGTPTRASSRLQSRPTPFATRPISPGVERNRIDWTKAADNVGKLAPYASNIVNAFRSAPAPMSPQLENATVDIGPANMNAARVDIDRSIRGAQRGVERTLTGQQASAVNAANLGTQLGAYSNVAQAENDQNRSIRMFNSQANQGVNARNVERINDYQSNILSRNIAQQRESSENLANFTDKIVADRTTKKVLKLDKEKYDILSRMYSRGLMGRVANGLTVPGTEDEVIRKNGGSITRYRSLKPIR